MTDNKPEIQRVYSLSPMQEGMLFHFLENKDSRAYFTRSIFSIRGKIEYDLLEKSLDILMETFDILRTIFHFEDTRQPFQIVLKKRKFKINFHDISHLEQKEKEKQLEEFKKSDREMGFDLTRDHLMRALLLKLTNNRYILIWSYHHIIMDGWSLGIIFKHFMQVYCALKEGKPLQLEPVTPYREYIKWLKEQDQQEGLNYWQEYLRGYEHPVAFPGMGKNRGNKEYKLKSFEFLLDGELKEGVIKIVSRYRLTLNVVFQTLWGLLLQFYNNVHDTVFGAVVAGRPPQIDGIDRMVGLFINTTPVRIKREAKQSFYQLFTSVHRSAIRAKPFEYLPLAQIQAHSSLKRNLINHIMAFENYPLKDESNDITPRRRPGFKVEKYTGLEQTNYDFNILITQFKAIHVKIDFNSNACDSYRVEKVALHFKKLLTQVLENVNIHLDKIEIISEEEKKQILDEFNRTGAEFPGHQVIHKLFEKQVGLTPHHIALSGAGSIGEGVNSSVHLMHLTYSQLNEQSDGWSQFLTGKGVQPDDIIGIVMERSIEMIVGIFTIIKAGAAYLPLDPGYPAARTRYMLTDSNVRILLTTPELQVKLETEEKSESGIDIFCPLSTSTSNQTSNSILTIPSTLPPTCRVSPTNLAYVIYTSGSTGRPKGVMIEHRAIINRLNWMQKSYPIGKKDVILQKTSFTFDVSLWELFWWSFHGASLYLLGFGEEKYPRAIMEAVARHNITTMHFVPSMLQAFLDYFEETTVNDSPSMAGLRRVFASGEELKPHLLEKFNKWLNKKKGTRLINLYGPTEAAVDVSYFNCPMGESLEKVPIGKPIDNIQLVIFDTNLHLQPIGIAGELCIAGVGLARGYLNNPELTAKKFVLAHGSWLITNKTLKKPMAELPMSNQPSAIDYIYKTGDLACWLPDGNIEFIGRTDQQVKIRGYRIETGEIENRLIRHDSINDAVVLAIENNDRNKELFAWIVSQKEFEIHELNEYLAQQLPHYMIPAHFTRIETMPLNANGKIDKKRLIKLKGDTLKPGSIYQEPGTHQEIVIANIWKELLHLDKVGINDNFFQLGGHSLNLLRMAAKIHKSLGVRVPMTQFSSTPTIKGLAKHIKNSQMSAFSSVEAVEKKEYYEMSPAQKRMYIIWGQDKSSLSYNMSMILILTGELDQGKLENTFRVMVKRHESFRTSFDILEQGPVQKVYHSIAFSIQYHDRANIKSITGGREEKQAIKEITRAFDLDNAPLLRVGLIKKEKDRYLLMICMHHIVSDAVSISNFVKESMKLYQGEKLPGLRIQYKDFSQWHYSEKGKDVLKKEEKYWLEEFAGELPVLNLPYDYSRPTQASSQGKSLSFFLEEPLTKRLKEIARKEDASLFMILAALFSIFLSKVSGQEEVIFGTPIVGRRQEELDPIIGMFVNTLVLKYLPASEKTFSVFFNEVKKKTLEAFENQDYPFEELVDQVVKNRDENRHPLFDVMLALQNIPTPAVKIPGLTLKRYHGLETRTCKFDLLLEVFEEKDRMRFLFTYSNKLFKKKTIEKFVVYIKKIVANGIEDPTMKLAKIKRNPGTKSNEIQALLDGDLENE